MANGNRGGPPIGNRNSVKNRPWREAIDKAIKQDNRNRLRKAAEALLTAAAAGDLDAIKELANRLDGRPGQRIELEVTDTQTERLLAAEERLRRYREERQLPSMEAEILEQLPREPIELEEGEDWSWLG